MEKLKMQSHDKVGDNVSKIAQLFPNCVTEILGKDGKPQLAIDFEKLQAELSNDIIAEGQERYQFTWPDKRAANRLANTPTTMTLRPCREESVDFDNTQNLYIEGDNLDVLKVLRETYLGKVKMIYIDPPYNTGKDFVYKDDSSISMEEWKERGNMFDTEGNLLTERMQRNPETNGRFHTDWLNMIYPRLKVARDLLSEDGVIFISIDDNEVENLRKVCDEIFGISNFIAQIVVEGTPKNDPYIVSTAHEYCIVFCKNFEKIKEANFGIQNPRFADLERIHSMCNGDYRKVEELLKQYYYENDLTNENISNYKYADEYGVFRIGPIDDPQNSGPKDDRMNPKTGRKCATPSSGWRCTLATWNDWIRQNLIYFPEDDNKLPAKKTYAKSDRLDVLRAYVKMQTRKDTDYLKRLFGTEYTPFSNPKPVELIRMFIDNCNDKGCIIMDFFSGSATTFHAMLIENLKDNGRRKCILVQLQEEIKVSSNQSNKEKKISSSTIRFCKEHNLLPNVCEIAKERIRRVGKKLKEENADKEGIEKLDIGFRVLKLDSSNMKDVYYTPSQFTIDDLFDENIKPDRTGEDLLFQVMLELGVELSAKIETKQVNGKKVHFVDDNYLIACFDTDVNESTITEIAKLQPIYFVMRDSSANNDKVIDNFDQIFRHYSPKTTCKII